MAGDRRYYAAKYRAKPTAARSAKTSGENIDFATKRVVCEWRAIVDADFGARIYLTIAPKSE